jgi:hypothetical protein
VEGCARERFNQGLLCCSVVRPGASIAWASRCRRSSSVMALQLGRWYGSRRRALVLNPSKQIQPSWKLPRILRLPSLARLRPGVTGHARHGRPVSSVNSRTLVSLSLLCPLRDSSGLLSDLELVFPLRSAPSVILTGRSRSPVVRCLIWRRTEIVCSAATAAASSASSRRRISSLDTVERPVISASQASWRRWRSSASASSRTG